MWKKLKKLWFIVQCFSILMMVNTKVALFSVHTCDLILWCSSWYLLWSEFLLHVNYIIINIDCLLVFTHEVVTFQVELEFQDLMRSWYHLSMLQNQTSCWYDCLNQNAILQLDIFGICFQFFYSASKISVDVVDLNEATKATICIEAQNVDFNWIVFMELSVLPLNIWN